MSAIPCKTMRSTQPNLLTFRNGRRYVRSFSFLMAFAVVALASASEAHAANTITICKATIPSGASGFPFLWGSGSSGPVTPFTLNDGQCMTFDVTTKDKFNKFTENVPSGWVLVNIVCSHTNTPVNILGANPNPTFQPGDNMVTMDLVEPNVTCTFVNHKPQEPSCRATICVKKYFDHNGNGIQESGDALLPGWTFQIKDSTGNVIASGTTNTKKNTCFSVPAPASYTVSEMPQAGWIPTLPPGGTKNVTVSAGQLLNLLFGNKPKKKVG
jgi:hypothetical protein